MPATGGIIKKRPPGDAGRMAKGGFAVEDPNLKTISESAEESCSPNDGRREKRDSETNTDLSAIMMQRAPQPTRAGVPGYALRRPLQGGVTPTTAAAAVKGLGLRPQSAGSKPEGQMKLSVARGGSVGNIRDEVNIDNSPPILAGNTLDRKKKGSKSSITSPEDYKSSTLGRRKPETNIKEKLFGSRNSLNTKQPTSDKSSFCPSTIISNPHATFGGRKTSQGTINDISPQGGSPYVNVNISGGYLSSDYLQGHHDSANNSWTKSMGVPPRSGMSETESMESLSSTASSVQAQIQQARAHGLMSRNILQHEHESSPALRSDSFKSTQSERIYSVAPGAHDLHRTGSYGQLSSPTSPTAPGYPLSALGGRSPTQSPYVNSYLPLSKLPGHNRDDDSKFMKFSIFKNLL